MLQVTERVATHQAAYLTPSFDFSIERAAGWPLINAVEAYETWQSLLPQRGAALRREGARQAGSRDRRFPALRPARMHARAAPHRREGVRDRRAPLRANALPPADR